MRRWRMGAGALMMAGGACAALSCCGRSSAPVPLKVGPSATTQAGIAGDVTSEPALNVQSDADIGPVLPLGGPAVVTKMPDGELWGLYPNGMAEQDLKTGASLQPMPGQTVYIFYTATVASTGKVFAQNEPGKPWSFRLGSDKVPLGLSTALYNTDRGSIRRWWIPPNLAYGAKGLPPLVGPNEAIIYRIELQQWNGKAVKTVNLRTDPMGPSQYLAPRPDVDPPSIKAPKPAGPSPTP